MATWIYHFTHVSNLPTILERGVLYCDRECQANGLSVRGAAYTSLKLRRAEIRVEAGPGGTLDEYVPLYFGTRSPMLYTYKNGNVTGKKENQDELIYLVTSAESVNQAGLKFVFTDGHPVKQPRQFFDDLGDLTEIDLALMTARMWNDTTADPDRMRRRQAEFLVQEALPWRLVLGIGVRTEAMRTTVEDQLTNVVHRPPCRVRPGWYYED